MIIRLETSTDAAAIRTVTEAAFAGAEHSAGTEAAIVEALRGAGVLTLSLVADDEGACIGHAAFSPVAIGGAEGRWFGLGPVSVRADRQRRGVGSALIRIGLERLGAQGAHGCVVLGDPVYYCRFGFVADPAIRLEGVPPQHLQRLALTGAAPQGLVAYHAAFGA
ncbi:MAG: N-acetyltransferase [Rhodobacteraceae bacterium]|nr:MAG: N-acetyltransferase [Paracoccaceae bacterium]